MIRVKRRKEQPEILYSKEIEEVKAHMEQFYARPLEERSQERLEFGLPRHINEAILRDLDVVFNGKCAYCETKVYVSQFEKHNPELEILTSFDRFRPPYGARDFERGFDPDHYWWLAHEWENMYLACPACMDNKATWFPLEGERGKPTSPHVLLKRIEYNLLIDPCDENPDEHLRFDLNGEVVPTSNKGDATITVLDLNRFSLVNDRLDVITEFRQLESNLTTIGNATNNELLNLHDEWIAIFTGVSMLTHLALRRRLIIDLVKANTEFLKLIYSPQLGKALNLDQHQTDEKPQKKEKTERNIELEDAIGLEDVELTATAEGEIPGITEPPDFVPTIDTKFVKQFKLKKLELHNYKCFEDMTIEFDERRSVEHGNKQLTPWLVFLGDNGVGKSSLLKAIALCLCGESYMKKVLPFTGKLLMHGKKEGFIKLYLEDLKDPVELHFSNDRQDVNLINPIAPSYLLGYGSVRLMPDSRIKPERGVRLVKIHNLFENSVSMIDAKKWMLNQKKSDFDVIAATLKVILDLPGKERLVRKSKTVRILMENGTTMSLSDMSDGYKSVLALCVDIMATLKKENLSYDLAKGIVLIDEIGTHLHPRWKMAVVKRMREAFPNMQFVVTTHEPLCLKGLFEGEIVVLSKFEGQIQTHTELPDPSKLRIDQILTSPLFGLNSVIDPEIEDNFDKYYALLARKSLATEQEPRWSELSKKKRLSKDEKNELANLEGNRLSEEEENELIRLRNTVEPIKQLGNSPREELATYIIDELLAKRAKQGETLKMESLKAETLNRVRAIWDILDDEEDRL
ncbi:MAG: AAA family ATPase [Bacteroidia bacterium]|nr:AAA family ATPase [Bacteroidia bacterium]